MESILKRLLSISTKGWNEQLILSGYYRASQKIKCARLSPEAIIPKVSQEGDVCIDLFSPSPYVVPAKSRLAVPIDVAFYIPSGYRISILPRSGMSKKNGVLAATGTVDTCFRKGVTVVLYNFSDEDYYIKAGDRIAQAALEKTTLPLVQEVSISEIPQNDRDGLGSSGR
jgi:dUTP pyrophosphatase